MKKKLINKTLKNHSSGLLTHPLNSSVSCMNKKDFLIEEFWMLSWNASVQRAKIYKKGTNEEDRKEFRKDVIDYCTNFIIPMYDLEVAEDKHLANIQSLTNKVSNFSSSRILNDGYKIGVAQKLLNLKLKYLWCLNFIPIPPHCPVDRIILSKTSLKDKMNWTQISTIEEYMDAIYAIKLVAGKKPLAEWELDNFDRS